MVLRRRISLFLLCVAMASGVGAATPKTEIDGEFVEGAIVQGSLLQGRTQEGADIWLDGEEVAIYEGGRFYLGFEYDHKPESVLKIKYADGTEETRKLKISPREYEVQHLKLDEKMVTPPKEVLQRIEQDAEIIEEKRNAITLPCYFNGHFKRPAQGVISGLYGSRRILNGKEKAPHRGLDIAGDIDAPITAPLEGKVALVRDMYYTGQTVLMDHGCGVFTVYAHLNSVNVKEGDTLKIGDPIGGIGKTGRATGPHLHWGLNLGNLFLDPELQMAIEDRHKPAAKPGDKVY